MEEKIEPLFVISVAAELAELHPQTLRQYDRLGLVIPTRQGGKQRRYSQRDIELLREVQRLSKEGVSLAGIKRVMELEHQVTALRSRVLELSDELVAERSHNDELRRAMGQPPRRTNLPRSASRALLVWSPSR